MISVGSVTINSYLGGKDGEILKTVSNAKREGGKIIQRSSNKHTQVVNIANATFRSPGPSSANTQTKHIET